jgi:hypothetical protein
MKMDMWSLTAEAFKLETGEAAAAGAEVLIPN